MRGARGGLHALGFLPRHVWLRAAASVVCERALPARREPDGVQARVQARRSLCGRRVQSHVRVARAVRKSKRKLTRVVLPVDIHGDDPSKKVEREDYERRRFITE